MTPRRAKRLASVLLALALVAGACASPNPEPRAEGDRSRLGRKAEKQRKGATGKKSQRREKQKTSARERKRIAEKIEKAPGGTTPPTQTTTGGAGGNPGPPKPTSVDPALARAASRVDDPSGDLRKSGITPGYADALGASIEGIGREFRFRVTFAEELPQKMPDDKTYFAVALGMNAGGEDRYGLSLYATQEGWKVFAGAKGTPERNFPGRFEVRGKEVVVVVPWSFIDGPRRFVWAAQAQWFRQLAGTQHYAYDLMPNSGTGKFPEG